MSAVLKPVPKGPPVTVEEVQTFLYSEARCLDDRDWDGWLAHYAPTATFWMPAWDEDRVFRIRTERSSATSLPEPRTSHNITNVELLEVGDGFLEVRFNWFSLSFRYKTTDTYFGTSFYTIDTSGENFAITRKKVVLKNDYIHHVVDIYHI
jgi:benzoate/toluate 1,2-dioxygenase beta subunit